MRALLLPVLVTLASPAHAEDAPSWAAGASWEPVLGAPEPADVLVDPAAPQRWWVVDPDGTVWVSEDAGGAWRVVLPGTRSRLGAASGEEEALLDAETRLGELLDDLDLDGADGADLLDLSDVVGDADDALRAATDAAVEQVQAEALGARWFRQASGVDEAGAGGAALAWLGEAVGVAREDGLWALPRAGHAAPERLRGSPTWAAAALPSGGVLALGPDGLVAHEGAGVWTPMDRAPGGAVDLRTPGGRVVLASDAGLWVTDDALTWDAWTSPVAPRVGVVSDLAQAGELLLAAGSAGVALSTDGGATWARVDEGLGAAPVRAVDLVDGLAVLASASGLYRLVPPSGAGELARGGGDDLPSLGELRVAAEGRVGLGSAAGARGPGVQVAGWLLPQVSAQLRWLQGDDRASSLDAGLEGGRDGDWQLQVWATWRPPGRKVVATDPQDLVVTDGAEGQGAYAGGFDQWMMLGGVGRDVTDHRLDVAERLLDLVGRRERLVGERAREGQSLREAVTRELRIAEIDAQLDALTDGAVTRYRSGRTGRGGDG